MFLGHLYALFYCVFLCVKKEEPQIRGELDLRIPFS